MKRTVVAFVVALALGVALAIAFGLFRGSDESQIRSALTRLAATVSVGEGDSNIVFRVRRIDRDFADLFDDDVRVSFPDLPYVPNGRTELANMAADLPTVWSRADASFDSVTVKLDDAHASATVQTTAKLVTSDRRATRNVDFLMRKVDGRWKILSVTVWPET